jgi:thiol-disulfide isomerase/thioredoxin
MTSLVALVGLLCAVGALASTYVLKLPKKPSSFSKFVPEGGERTGITDALDVGHRFAAVGNTLVELAWSDDVRYFSVRHFEKLTRGTRMWAVLLVSSAAKCAHCLKASLEFEAVAKEFKDFVDFAGVDALEQPEERDYFREHYGFVVDRVPTLLVFRTVVDRTPGKFELMHYAKPIERDAIQSALTHMMPHRIQFIVSPPPETCLRGRDALAAFLAPDRPTLLALPKRTKVPPAFLRAMSEDLHGKIAVHQLTDEPNEVCEFLLRRALLTGPRPALLLLRPLSSLVLGDANSIDHFRVPSHDTMSHGAVRRWLDLAWTKIGMPGQLNSAYMIPKYRSPAMMRKILDAELKENVDEAYNEAVDRAVEERDPQPSGERTSADSSDSSSSSSSNSADTAEHSEYGGVDETEHIDFRSEL